MVLGNVYNIYIHTGAVQGRVPGYYISASSVIVD